MKSRTLFHYSVFLLLDAYLKNKLMHGNCATCAIGTLIAGNLDYELKPISFVCYTGYIWNEKEYTWNEVKPVWQTAIATSVFNPQNPVQRSDFEKYISDVEVKRQINATGYTFNEVAKIEYAFESAKPDKLNDRVFSGLMAVVDVLAELSGLQENEVQQIKIKFKDEL